MNYIEELSNRELIHSKTPDLEALFSQKQVIAYAGFDPTSDSIHIGNLATLMLLVRLQRHGHKPIVLIGGATGMIGDPSGKSHERNLLSEEILTHNVDSITKQLRKFLDFEHPTASAEIVNNYDWMKQFSFLNFLRDVGKQLTVNYMLAKDSVQKRLETGLSFTEFSYQLIQAYDFYYLYKHKNCVLQVGGSDQWGNITAGTELIRRMLGQSGHGLTCPLLVKSDGSKFGKSESGNIWISPERTSPYKFYQYFLNTADDDLQRIFMVFSLKSIEEINEILAEHPKNPEKRIAQKAIAEELTSWIHSPEVCKQVIAASLTLFSEDLNSLQSISPSLFEDVFEGVPRSNISMEQFESWTILDIIHQCQIVPSKTEGRKALQAGSIRVNKEKLSDTNCLIKQYNLIHNKFLIIQKGKKNYYLIEIGLNSCS